VKLNKRQKVLGGLLLITLIAAIFAPPVRDGVIADATQPRNVGAVPAQDRSTAAISAPHQTGEHMLLVRARTEAVEPGVVFETPPVEKKQKTTTVIVEAPPQAPPLPFRYLGQQTDVRGLVVFVQFGDQNLVLMDGSTVGDAYRVEKVADGMVTFRYLPLNQTQTLSIGNSRQ
jgi:hypothetical protein